MPTVVLCAHGVVDFPDGGGHLWVYLQYVHGLRSAGCDVWWLERLTPSEDPAADRRRVEALTARLSWAGLDARLIVYTGGRDCERRYLTRDRAEAERVFARSELLLNFHYGLDRDLLQRFARRALVDIDPGLLQVWIDRGLIEVGPHDVYFTTGATVGTPAAAFPNCGLDWVHIPPAVSLEQWPFARAPDAGAFTTVSNWWGDEWMCDEHGEWYENNKRVSFLEYAPLPGLVSTPLELALNTGPDDAADLAVLAGHGWRLRHAGEVTATPQAYRAYVQRSRGEFSCVKPSCLRLQNAWVSDRTLCYLASGRPAVVQHTGASPYLDGGQGLLRFSSLEEAAAALEAVEADYGLQRVAARELAERWFRADRVAARILDSALGTPGRPLAGRGPKAQMLRPAETQ